MQEPSGLKKKIDHGKKQRPYQNRQSLFCPNPQDCILRPKKSWKSVVWKINLKEIERLGGNGATEQTITRSQCICCTHKCTLYSHLLMILMLFYFGANMELCELLLSGDKVKALANALLMQEGVPWRQFCILQLLSVCFFYHAVKLG